MRPRTARITAATLGLVSLTTLVLALASVRPADAQPAGGSYALTYDGAAAGPAGGVGASGGLVVLDGGPAHLSGRLDSGPSASAEASSVEPGTMARLLIGQANGAGAPGLTVPTTARADFPGATDEDDASVADQTTGPVTVAGGEAHVQAGAAQSVSRAGLARLTIAGAGTDAAARATVLRSALDAWRRRYLAPTAASTHVVPGGRAPAAAGSDPAPPLLTVDGATGDARAAADDTPGSTATVHLGRLAVLDTIVIEDVTGHAAVGLGEDGTPNADANLTVAAATVGGVPVAIDEQGVRVADRTPVSGDDLDAASTALNQALSAAGVQVSLLPAAHDAGAHDATGDSGGVRIRITTPSNSGVPRNVVALIAGRVTTTLTSGPAPAAVAPPSTTGSVGSTSGAGTSGTAGLAPTADIPVASAPASGTRPPQVAPSAAPSSGDVMVAGRRVSARTAYAGFAAWLLFTFTIPVLIAITVGRRAVAVAA